MMGMVRRVITRAQDQLLGRCLICSAPDKNSILASHSERNLGPENTPRYLHLGNPQVLKTLVLFQRFGSRCLESLESEVQHKCATKRQANGGEETATWLGSMSLTFTHLAGYGDMLFGQVTMALFAALCQAELGWFCVACFHQHEPLYMPACFALWRVTLCMLLFSPASIMDVSSDEG